MFPKYSLIFWGGYVIFSKTLQTASYADRFFDPNTPWYEKPFDVLGAGLSTVGDKQNRHKTLDMLDKMLLVDQLAVKPGKWLAGKFFEKGTGTALKQGAGAAERGAAEAGAANFMSDSDKFFQNASKRSDIDSNGLFDVVAHGSPNKIKIETPNSSVLVDHRTAARLIQQQPGYNGQNIRLLSCSTGACDTGFAQNLANNMNVEVHAPTDLLWAYPDGKMLVAPEMLNLKGYPDLAKLGDFRIFQPK
jgi:hypothetical protein